MTSLMVSTMAGDWDLTEVQQQEQPLKLQQQQQQLRGKQAGALPSELELPRHSADASVPNAALASAERMLGRASMVAALVLVANELATGQSLPEQIMSVLCLMGN